MNWEEYRSQLGAHALWVVYASTPDCSACTVLRPKVESVVVTHPRWRYQILDLTTHPEIRGQALLFTVPTILLYVEGREVQRFSRSLVLEDLESAMNRVEQFIDDSGGD